MIEVTYQISDYGTKKSISLFLYSTLLNITYLKSTSTLTLKKNLKKIIRQAPSKNLGSWVARVLVTKSLIN